MAVTKGFPQDFRHQLTKEMIRSGPALQKEGGLWGFWSKEGMVAGLNECNTNAGAIKAYKEAKVWDLQKKGRTGSGDFGLLTIDKKRRAPFGRAAKSPAVRPREARVLLR